MCSSDLNLFSCRRDRGFVSFRERVVAFGRVLLSRSLLFRRVWRDRPPVVLIQAPREGYFRGARKKGSKTSGVFPTFEGRRFFSGCFEDFGALCGKQKRVVRCIVHGWIALKMFVNGNDVCDDCVSERGSNARPA